MSNDYNGKKRSELPDSVFGIPQERKYPMPDEKHTRSAIKLFNHVDPKYEEQLAKAVIKNMKKYGIDGSAVGPNNRLRKYLPEDMIKESMNSLLYEYMYTDNDPDIIIQESGYALTWRIMPILLKAVLSGVDQYDYKYLREKKLPAILKKCKTMDDIKYMRRDAITAKTQLEILKRNVHAVNTNDEQIMKRLNKSFIKKVKDGKITEKEIDTHIRWLSTEYKKLIDARAKEIRDSMKESYINEGFVKSDKDIYYNKDKFDSGEINLCFITGHSGSGKSTMARSMQSSKIEHYELDDLNQNYKFTDDNLKEYGDLIYSFFKGVGKKYRYYSYDDMQNCTNPLDDSGDEFDKCVNRDFVKYAMKYTKSHKNIKFVIEGIWLYFFFKPEELKEYAVYIKGTSRVLSAFRAAKRDSQDADTKTKRFIYSIKGTLSTLINKYSIEGERLINNYRKYYENIQEVNESSSILPQDTGISTVIFDLGDVLVSANIKDYLSGDPEVPNEIIDELLKLWFIDKDEVDDTMDLDTYREIVNKRMGTEFSKYISNLFKANIDCVAAFDYTIPMIQDLKDKGYKVYYLSNWSAWTHDLLQEAGKFDFLKLMDGGVFSYDVGYMKPDKEIYKILLNKYKINPEEAMFFDDKEENIEAANKLGIHGVHYTKHDPSIIYTNLYGRKLAKAIYEDMDSIRYDFDHSYNEIQQEIRFNHLIESFEKRSAIKEKVINGKIIKGKFIPTSYTLEFELPKRLDEQKVSKEILNTVKPIIMTSQNKTKASRLGLTLKCEIEEVDSGAVFILVLDGSQDKRDTNETRAILKDLASKCKAKLSDIVSKVDIGDGDEGCLYFTMDKSKIKRKRKDLLQESVEIKDKIGEHEIEDIKTIISSLQDGSFDNFRFENIVYCNIKYKYKEPIAFITIRVKVVNYSTVGFVSLAVNPKYQNQGIGKSLTTKAVSWFKKEKGIHFLEWYCLQNNEASKKLANDVGFREYIAKNNDEYIRYTMESSIQEYGTTGGTIVGANQPDSVYIVNYMQNNVFSGYKEPKQAICKKGMNQMYTTKNGKAVPVDKDKFKEEASGVSVFRFKETPILSFDKIIENASVDGDFYILLTGDYPTNQHEIEYDNRFVQEENFLNELDDIACCTESTITGQVEAIDYPYMKVLTESMEGRCWNYYRDINGVFAMNELTGLRTPSYEDITDIPNSQIQLIERGTVYAGE